MVLIVETHHANGESFTVTVWNFHTIIGSSLSPNEPTVRWLSYGDLLGREFIRKNFETQRNSNGKFVVTRTNLTEKCVNGRWL